MQKNRVSAEYPGVTRDSSPSCEQRQTRISLPSLHPARAAVASSLFWEPRRKTRFLSESLSSEG